MATMTLLPSLFHSYPEILLAVACFSFFLFFRCLNRSRRKLLVDWPLVGHLPYLLLHAHDFHDWCTDLLRASGCTFVFAPPAGALYDVVLTCDPANVNHVFNANFLNYTKGEGFSEIFDFLGHGIFNSDGDSWKFQRKKAHSLMASPRFRSFVAEASRSKVEHGLIPLLSHFAEGCRVLDLQDVFLRFSFDTTCALVFGIDPGCLSVSLPTVPFAKALDDAEEVSFFRHNVPVTWWKLLRRLRMGPERKMHEAVEVLDRFVSGYVSRRREEKRSGGDDLLSSYLDCQAEAAECGGFDRFDTFLRDTTVNLMVAGRDTVSSALTWFFYMVIENPSVEAKILAEVREHGASDLGKLVYMHAAILESLRLFPPVPFEHKDAVSAERLPSGEEVHDKRRIIFSIYSMGRMEGIWGEDCLEYRPERWISESGKIRHEPSYKFFAFNAGPRTCLGKDMAFAQLKTVAAAVIDKFEFAVAEGFVARRKLSIILYMRDGLMVRVRKRAAA